MDISQLEKRIDWLDDERRKDKNTIAQLKDRVVTLEGKLRAAEHENKTLLSEMTHIKTAMGRLDRMDDALTSNRADFTQIIAQQKQQAEQRETELKKLLRADIQVLETNLAGAQKILKELPAMRESIDSREAEEKRLAEIITNLSQSFDEIRMQSEDQTRSYRVIEDGRRQDTQRLTDLQGEVTALRKRSDEYRGRFDVFDAEFRRIESRLKEVAALEREITEAQAAFIEKHTSSEAEREKSWKSWASRFEIIESQSGEIENYLRDIEQAHLEMRRAQENIDELSKKVERRINELTEMQRLSEERFRQGWNTFKADDQKRWTNYLLSHDEQQSDISRRIDRLTERATLIEDGLQEMQDFLQEVNDFSAKRLQGLLEVVRDWAVDYERLQGTL
ncbi:MAG: hypothetical protein H8E28_08355 [Anaerolineae bacterium]|nr:hypothetical protein [Anaerolineae bacterium]